MALAETALDSFAKNDGYEFVGWAVNGETVDVNNAKAAGPAIYVVQWKEKEYTVTFNPGSHAAAGSQAVEKMVKHNTNLESSNIAPAFEGAAGWVFDCWSPELSNNVIENQTYTAQWKMDVNRKHAATIEVQYYLDGVHQADEDETVVADDLLAIEVTVDAASAIDLNQFPGYRHQKTEGSTSFTLAAGADTPASPQVIRVYLAKDDTQMHTARALVQYWVGETVETDKLVEASDVMSQTAWVGDLITLTLTANTTDKFPGYKYDAQVSDSLTHTLAAFADSDAVARVAKVYYVKAATQTHAATVKVNYWYGKTVADAKLKAQYVGGLNVPDFATEFSSDENGWLGASVTATAKVDDNLQNSTEPGAAAFKGYKYETHVGSLEYTLAAGVDTPEDPQVVNVYYTKNDGDVHSASITVRYVAGDSGKDYLVNVDPVETWLNEDAVASATVNTELNESTNPDHAAFKGYRFESVTVGGQAIELDAEGKVSNTVAAGDPTPDQPMLVVVNYVKDATQTHTAAVTVNYWTGDTLAAAQAAASKEGAVPAHRQVASSEDWVKTPVSASVAIDENLQNSTDSDLLAKFAGYTFAGTNDVEPAVALGENADSLSKTVNVYYVKNEADTHQATIQVNYFYGDTLAEAQGKAAAGEVGYVQVIESKTAWMGAEVTAEGVVDVALQNSADPDAAAFKGYKYQGGIINGIEGLHESGAVSKTLAIGEKSSTDTVNVFYVKDVGQTHFVGAKIEYYYGRTLDEAQAKSEPDAYEEYGDAENRIKYTTAEGWLGEDVTLSVTADLNKFNGYMVGSVTVNGDEAQKTGENYPADYEFAVKKGEVSAAFDFENTNTVRVYYVANLGVTHSVSAQVRYYYGNTLADAQAKAAAMQPDAQDNVVTELAWLHDVVSVAPMIDFAKFSGYKVAGSDNARTFSVILYQCCDLVR